MGVRRRRNFFTSGAWLRVFVERVVLVGSILLAFGLQACSSTVQSDDVPQFQVDPTWAEPASEPVDHRRGRGRGGRLA